MKFSEVAAIDVRDKTRVKGNLTYLSWAHAVDQLLRLDPAATWEHLPPTSMGDQTVMVWCNVKAFGKSMTAHLPVMDHRNKAIPNPNAFDVNKAMQRCLTKAIALHGLGLYIYAGEDLPADADDIPQTTRDREKIVEAAADEAVRLFGEDQAVAAYEAISGITDNEEKMYLWNYLKPHSALRASIKKMAQADAEAERKK